MGVAVKTGEVKPLTSKHEWEGVWSIAWFGDGSGLVFSARETGAPNNQIFQLSFPVGEVRRITNDLVHYGPSVDLTAD